MKYRLFAIAVLVVVLGGLALTQQEPSQVTAQPSSSADDSSMKTLKIE